MSQNFEKLRSRKKLLYRELWQFSNVATGYCRVYLILTMQLGLPTNIGETIRELPLPNHYPPQNGDCELVRAILERRVDRR